MNGDSLLISYFSELSLHVEDRIYEDGVNIAARLEGLAVTVWDLGLFFVYFSSEYRILRSADPITKLNGFQ